MEPHRANQLTQYPPDPKLKLERVGLKLGSRSDPNSKHRPLFYT